MSVVKTDNKPEKQHRANHHTVTQTHTLTMPCRTAPAISSLAPWFWRRTQSRFGPGCVWGRIRGTTGRDREGKNIHVINAKHTHTDKAKTNTVLRPLIQNIKDALTRMRVQSMMVWGGHCCLCKTDETLLSNLAGSSCYRLLALGWRLHHIATDVEQMEQISSLERNDSVDR